MPARSFGPATTVVGSKADGLWTAVTAPSSATSGGSRQYSVLRLDANTGQHSVEALVPAPAEAGVGIGAGEAAVFGGAFYLIGSPSDVKGFVRFTTITRVTPLS